MKNPYFLILLVFASSFTTSLFAGSVTGKKITQESERVLYQAPAHTTSLTDSNLSKELKVLTEEECERERRVAPRTHRVWKQRKGGNVPKVKLKRAKLKKVFRFLQFRNRRKRVNNDPDDDIVETAHSVGFGVASIVFAGLSFIFFWFPFVGAAFGLVGIVLGLIGLGADTDKIPAAIGLVGSIFMFLLGLGWTALVIYLFNNVWFF